MENISVQSDKSQHKLFYPKIISQKDTSDSVLLILEVPQHLEFFKGHFSGFPILPGVVQVHWVYKFAQSLFNLHTPGEIVIPKLKFSRPVYPGNTLSLELKYRFKKSELYFQYKDESISCSSGVLRFER